jgi:hypothetical protein
VKHCATCGHEYDADYYDACPNCAQHPLWLKLGLGKIAHGWLVFNAFAIALVIVILAGLVIGSMIFRH